MKNKSLIIYFVILVILCTGFVVGARGVGQQGAYLVQGYMMTPAIAALITRLFFYEPRFKDSNLRFGRARDYLKYWLVGLGITALSFVIYTLLGAIRWNFSAQVFLDRLAEQKIIAESEAFRAMHAELLQQYRGEYVAVHNKKVVDHDEDICALNRRIRARYGRQAVLLQQVTEQPEVDLVIRSPKLEPISR